MSAIALCAGVPVPDYRTDTDGFWSAMCHPGFVRLSMHYGQIGQELYFCAEPPELVPATCRGALITCAACYHRQGRCCSGWATIFSV